MVAKDFFLLSVIILNVILVLWSVIVLNVILVVLDVILLNVILVKAILQSVILLNVRIPEYNWSVRCLSALNDILLTVVAPEFSFGYVF